jgi:periplasmic protein TonB
MVGMNRMMSRAFLVSVLFHLAVVLSFRVAPLLPETSRHIDSLPISAILVPAPRERSQTPPFENASPAVGRSVAPGIETASQSSSKPKSPFFQSISRSTVTDDVAVTERASVATAIPGAAAPVINSPVVAPADISVEGVRQYRLNLAREARRFKRYPELARERGWEGVVVVVVNTAAGATAPLVSLSQSSGFNQLDQAALELLETAVQTAVLPESLRGRQFGLTLPVDYRLGD